MSNLHFDADIDDKKLVQKVNKIDDDLKALALKAANSGKILDGSFQQAGRSADDFSKKTINAGNAMQYIGTVVSLSFVAQFAKQIANVRGEWQKYEAVLTNTLGSNEDAVASLDMIAKYGAKTNFQVNELTDSFVKLASQGFKPTRDEMASLGDLAASKAKGFDQLTEALIDAETFEFERLKEFGIRAAKDGEKITFTFKGIKTSVDASAEAVRNYVLSLGQLDGVKGSTDAISKTIVGMASNFEDAFNQMLNSIGKSQEGLIAGSIQAATNLVNNYEKVVSVLKVLVASYGAYKAASIAVSIIESYRATSLVTQSVRGMYQAVTVTKQLTFAQWASVRAQSALNVVTAANPYVLAATAIAGLVAALIVFSDKADEAKEAQRKLTEQIEGEKARIDTLVTIIKAETTANADRARAIKDLNDLMPDSILYLDKQTLSTKEGKKAIDDYIDSITKRAKLEDLQAQLAKNNTEQERVAAGGTPSGFNYAEKAAFYLQAEKDKDLLRQNSIKRLKEEQLQIKKNIEEIVSGKNVENEAGKNTISVSQQILSTRKKLSDEEKKLKDLRKSASTATPEEIKKQQGLVDGLKEQLKVLTGIDEEKKKQSKTIDDQIKALEEKLKTLKGAEYEAAVKLLAVLQDQKELQEQILEMDLKLARNKPLIAISTRKANEDIARQLGIDTTKKTPDKIKTDFEGEKLHAKAKKIADDQLKADEDRLEIQKRLIDGAYEFTQQLVDQLDLTESQAEALRGAVDIFANVASGNIISAGFGALTQMMKGTDYSEFVFKAFAAQLEVINNLLRENQRIIDQSKRTGGQEEAYEQRLQLLKEQEKLLVKQVELAEKALRGAESDQNSLFGWLFGSTKEERAALEQARRDLQEVQNSIEDIQQEWDDFLRGGLTENTIADSIAEGFRQGKTSVTDFAEFVNSMLFDAVFSVFKAEILGPEITALSQYVKASLLDNVLTSEEINQVQQLTNSIIEKNKPLWDSLTSALNKNTATNSMSPLTGSIAGASEETMSMLAGQTMAIRNDIKINQNIMQNQLEAMDDALGVLNNIARNTSHNSVLPEIHNELKSMNDNIKKLQ